MKRTLSLKREALTELTDDVLRAAIVGGQSGATCPVGRCVEDLSYALGCVGSYQCPTWTC